MDAMDAKTAVSIIIPFYNGIDWLEMIFVAFGKQTFKDFEVIVADDGSREDVVARLEELMAAINLANCRTVVDGLTLTERIARKDCLRLRLEAYRELVQAASQTARRATRSEIRILSAVDVRALQGKVDAMARELRLLDNQLQQINWTTEL